MWSIKGEGRRPVQRLSLAINMSVFRALPGSYLFGQFVFFRQINRVITREYTKSRLSMLITGRVLNLLVGGERFQLTISS
jgi:hypothetical protein